MGGEEKTFTHFSLAEVLCTDYSCRHKDKQDILNKSVELYLETVFQKC